MDTGQPIAVPFPPPANWPNSQAAHGSFDGLGIEHLLGQSTATGAEDRAEPSAQDKTANAPTRQVTVREHIRTVPTSTTRG